MADGGIPMPLLTCVHVKKDRSARSFQGTLGQTLFVTSTRKVLACTVDL